MNKKVFLASIMISLLTIILSANSQALYSCDNNQTIILLSGTSNAHAQILPSSTPINATLHFVITGYSDTLVGVTIAGRTVTLNSTNGGVLSIPPGDYTATMTMKTGTLNCDYSGSINFTIGQNPVYNLALSAGQRQIIEWIDDCPDAYSVLTKTLTSFGTPTTITPYSTKICFNEIFENNYLGANPNQCTGTNKVVRISGTTNAHLEDPTQTTQGYTDVCYGNLVCTPRTLQNCQNYEQLVMKLYTNKNSHATTASGTAPINICCRITSNVTSGPHWENFAGQEITNTSIGSTVKLIVPGIDLDKVLINYTIQKKTTFWLFFTTWREAATISTKGVATWTPTGLGVYKFLVQVPQKEAQESPELTVSGEGQNIPPTVSIISIIDGGIYFLDNTLNFTQNASDTDDPQLTYLWNFGDGTTSTNANEMHKYQTPGQKTIVLKVTDSRGAIAEAKVDILIVNSSYALAYISKPTYNQLISGLSVTFDASNKSYVVNVSHNPNAIQCLAGNCPNQTADGSVPVTGTPASIANVGFSWKLNDGYTSSGTGASFGSFNYQFSTAGAKWAIMNISTTQTSSTTWANFTLYLSGGIPYCSVSGNSASWVTSSGSTSSMNNCYQSNGQPGQKCCPGGYSCDTTTGSCVAGTQSNITFCSDYKSQNECTGDTYNVAATSVKSASGGNITCDTILRQYQEGGVWYKEEIENCRCEWKTNQCKSAYNQTKRCVDGSCRFDIGICETSMSAGEDLCSTPRKVKTYDIVSLWSGSPELRPESCQSSTIEKSCLDFSQVKLPFFELAQVIISAIMITIFYVYIKRRKNN